MGSSRFRVSIRVLGINRPEPLKSPPLWQRMVAACSLMLVATGSTSLARTTARAVSADAAVTDLVAYGLRAWGLMRVRVLRMSQRPPPIEICALLALAFSCLRRQYRGVPTIIDQAVHAARALGGPQSAAYVNAVLRRVTREPQAATLDEWHLMALTNAPPWMVGQLLKAGTQTFLAHCAVVQRPPVFALRYLGAPDQAADWQRELEQKGHAVHWVRDGVRGRGLVLDPPCPVEAIPGFAQGFCRVQDLSAQEAFGLLPLRAGDQVLDVCAAPGGKTLLLAEQAEVAIWAADQSEDRLRRLSTEWARLRHHFPSRELHLVVADMSQSVWPETLPPFFDHIVLDAPCSGSGIVRRHPEIPWARSQEDLDQLVRLQALLLRRAWRALRPGGQLLYITCSLFPQEGEMQIIDFLQETADAQRLSAPGQILPYHEKGPPAKLAGDGFFYARLQKRVGCL